ncbi:vitamin D3 hydroxylase-associated protein isoform X2 [Bombina bombina]|uniref:vitamin D3 hydroxylase-associated protein isoform X2 n=1 Tax=Bombina bombina TaxID=8345 RepID=UPI00235B2967|nr:vitamin D3 hydroxylase-associated protein isoform X2 [Bombina bombina]
MLYDTLSHSLSEHQKECKLLATLGCCVVVSALGLRWIRNRSIICKMELEQKKRDKSIQEMEKAVTRFKRQNPETDSRNILKMTLMELTEKLKDGSLTPEEVLYTYIGKALETTKEFNCVTMFLADCETQLQELKKQKEKGLLYGVPVSIKDHIDYQGLPSTCGLVQYLEELKKEDSVIVKVLKKQGAIIFAKTNVPQSLISYETSNTIYGCTLNPHNKTKSCAGSSGGEGALIGAGGSILGIGTDLGGSIRLPSSFCGIPGFKPTPKRVSIMGIRSAIDGLLSVPLSVGPMARDVDSITLCMKALLCEEMFRLDAWVPPLPFNEELYSTEKPLRIGYYETDSFFMPSPGMRRVVLETKKLLEEAGHKLIRFTPPRIEYMMNELCIKSFFGDGGETMREKFKPNIVDPNLKDQVFMYNIPRPLKKILSFILKPLEYQAEFLNEWRKLNLDVILCPMLGPAFNLGYPGKLLAAINYTVLYNVLQFPVGVVPVSSVTNADEEEMKLYKGYNKDLWDKLFKKALEGTVGLPLSVQCVALPFQDELCLHFMKEVETLHKLHQIKK